MPKMDGLAAFEAMRQIEPDVKVVLVSGYDESEATGGSAAADWPASCRSPIASKRWPKKSAACCTPHAPRRVREARRARILGGACYAT